MKSKAYLTFESVCVSLSLSLFSLWHHVRSLVNMFKVMRLRILFDVFLNVPTGQMSFQIFFDHEVHGCLCSQKHTCISRRNRSHGVGLVRHVTNGNVGGLYLGQVFGDSSPSVSIWYFSMLQVHCLLPNIFIQKNRTIV